MTDAEVRFWAKVDQSGGPDACWRWQASHAGPGYGKFWLDGRNVASHRQAWIFTFGPIPPGEGYHGTCVCHHCDVMDCCNPLHLFLGSQAENYRDAIRKGRARPFVRRAQEFA